MKNSSIRMALLLIAAAVINFLVYYGGKWVARDFPYFSMKLPLDDAIPMLSWTIVIYLGGYFFWIANYYLSIKNDTSGYDRFFIAHCIGELVCLLIFILIPTAMVRPEIIGTSLFERILHFTYSMDSADTLFPSIHCFLSWLSWIGVRNSPAIPGWYRKSSLLLAIAVCLSTLTVKQHVAADCVAGIVLAELSYRLAGCAGRYRRRPGKRQG
ncbi:MAG: phosphatidic acid phosphatase [Firmicutes bacterium]|nr:phosphatidic acid phosphatase [Bacillota bacterium]